MVRIALSLTFLAAAALPAYGQTGSQRLADRVDLRPGERVRVTAPDIATKPIEGQIVRVEDEQLTLAPAKFGEPYRHVPLAALTQLEVSRGVKKYTAQGAVLGALAGGIAGYLVGQSQLREAPRECTSITIAVNERTGQEYSSEVCTKPSEPEGTEEAGLITLAGAVGGAFLGALIGSAIKIDRWYAVPVGNPSVTVNPAGRAHVSLTLKSPL